MELSATETTAVNSADSTRPEARPYEPPSYEVISLDCEITSYAPDDGNWPYV